LTLPYEELPVADPGTPDTRGPGHYLTWLARRQFGTLALAVAFGIGWMLPQALVPVAIGRAIDEIKPHHTSALFGWALVILVLGGVQAVCGTYRHQLAVTNWMKGTYRSIQVVGRHLSNEGTSVVEEIPAGDVVNTVASDAMRIGGAFDVLARFVGAIVSWLVVSVILLMTSVKLGLIVLIGVPVLGALTVPMMKPLHATQAAQREAAGRLAALGADTVAGLRILRGIGGEDVFHENYRLQSQSVRRAGNRVAGPLAALESGQVVLPAVLTVIVVYVGGHDVAAGTLSAGQLVTFFLLSSFLTTPLRTAVEYVIATTRAYVGARKVLAILSSNSPITEVADPAPWPATVADYRDERSGVVVEAGRLVALVTETTAEASTIADRLGRFDPDAEGVFVGATAIDQLALDEVRRRIVVSEVEPRLFSGDVRSELSPHARLSDEELLEALASASALDVVDALDGGLDAPVEERGRSFSGGQRQRLALARALLSDADLLVLIEPTSAVDTHTEGRIATRLAEARRGRSTLIATASPLILERVDEVQLVIEGHVVARGRYDELMRAEPELRRIVHRGSDE
jgi:ABC-type multidrug transport system fused ATPase/permease subunit